MLSKGQTDDFCAYMAGCTGILWILGGLSTGLAIPTIAASVVGLSMNQPRRSDSLSVDESIEQQLLAQGYGVPCVDHYRQRRHAGIEPQLAARDAIFKVLQSR